MKKNDIIELSITDTGEDSQGIGRFRGFAFFVKDALPGDVVKAVVTKVNRGYGYAKTLEIIKPSPDRVDAPCPTARRCGGCQLMELSYKKQLEIKEEKVWNNLMRLGGVNLKTVQREPIMGMETTDIFCPLHYRNKVQIPAGRSKDGRPVFGFYAGRTHYIVETEDCLAAFAECGDIIKVLRRFMEENNVPVYDEKTGKGLVRHVLLRKGFATGQIMVCIVVNAEFGIRNSESGKWNSEFGIRNSEFEKPNEPDGRAERVPPARSVLSGGPDGLCEAQVRGVLLATGLNITSICINFNNRKTNVILGEKTVTIYGNPYIEDRISGLTFRISAQSFFQVNSIQTEKLYSKALEYAALTGNETVWDLYCGIGTISLFLARNAKKVYGVEIVPQAIKNAKENAKLNGIENAEFFCGKSEEVFPEFYSEGSAERADVVVLDPPRKGCDSALLEAIMKAAPKRIVYISCSSATLARDVKILSRKYRLEKAAPCDMFPHTLHVETVVLMSIKDRKPDTHINVSLDMDDYYRIIDGKKQQVDDV